MNIGSFLTRKQSIYFCLPITATHFTSFQSGERSVLPLEDLGEVQDDKKEVYFEVF